MNPCLRRLQVDKAVQHAATILHANVLEMSKVEIRDPQQYAHTHTPDLGEYLGFWTREKLVREKQVLGGVGTFTWLGGKTQRGPPSKMWPGNLVGARSQALLGEKVRTTESWKAEICQGNIRTSDRVDWVK